MNELEAKVEQEITFAKTKIKIKGSELSKNAVKVLGYLNEEFYKGNVDRMGRVHLNSDTLSSLVHNGEVCMQELALRFHYTRKSDCCLVVGTCSLVNFMKVSDGETGEFDHYEVYSWFWERDFSDDIEMVLAADRYQESHEICKEDMEVIQQITFELGAAKFLSQLQISEEEKDL